MKNVIYKIMSIILFTIVINNLHAQVYNYTFTSSSGVYTPITGETVLWSGFFDSEISDPISIPAFNFDGIIYNSLVVSVDGYLVLGSINSAGVEPISSIEGTGIISAFGADIDNAETGTPKISYATIGNEFIVQYQDVKNWDNYGNRISFQIRLNTATNAITYIYGGTISAGTFPFTCQVGLRGQTNERFCNRTTNTNWATSTNGTENYSSCQFGSTVLPTNGLTYTFIPPTCIIPANLAVNSIMQNSANITWVSSASNFNVRYRLVGSSVWITDAVTSSPLVLSGLVPGSNYEFQVQAVCGITDTSTYSFISGFTTLCDAMDVPINQNFDVGIITPEIPICWRSIVTGSEAGVYTIENASMSSPNSVNLYNGSDLSATIMLISPNIIPDVNTTRVNFSALGSNNGSLLKVGVLNDPNDTSTFVEVQSIALTNSVENYSILLNTYTGTGKYIAFKHGRCSDYNSITIDDIVIETIPNCIEPSALFTSAITENTATINWSADPLNATNGYSIIYKEINTNNWISNTSTNSSVILNGLQPSTQYVVMVQANCGTNGLSAWNIDSLYFSTSCTPFNIPIIENFDAITNNSIPVCWNKIINTTSYAGISIADYNANTDMNCLVMENSFDNAATLIFVSPEISPDLNTLRVSFNTKGSALNVYNLFVGTITNPTDASTFTKLDSFAIPASGAYTNYFFNLNQYAGSDKYIAIKHGNGGQYRNIYIDDILIEPIPTCIEPSSLNTTISSDTVYISCDGNTTNYIFEYQLSTENTWNSNTTTTSTIIIPALISSSTYQYRIRAICGSDSSAFTNINSFTTPCLPNNLFPWFESFENIILNDEMPNCMTATNLGTKVYTYTSSQFDYNQNARTGSKFLSVAWASNEWIFTPLMSLNAGTSYDFSFYYIADGLTGFNLKAMIGTAQDSLTMTLDTGIIITDVINTTYQKYKISFTPTVSGNYSMGINVTSNDNPMYLTIDDIGVDLTPTCIEPSDIVISNITTSSAMIAWNSSASNFLIRYRIIGGDTNWQYLAISDTLLSLFGLTHSSIYEFQLQAICSATDSSYWTEIYTFNTLCMTLDIPYYQNFDLVTAPIIPNCLTITDNNSIEPNWVTEFVGVSGNAIKIGYTASGDGPLNDWFFSPSLNLIGEQSYQLEFKYKGGDFTPYVERLEVKYGTSANAMAMTDTLFKRVDFIEEDFQNVTVLFTPTNSGVFNIGWHAFSQEDQLNIYIDDISITAQGLSDKANISSFIVNNQVGNSQIDTTAATVTFTMPYGSNISSLSPIYTLSNGATAIPASGTNQNFTSPVQYTVTAANQISTKIWNATAIIELPSTDAEITNFSIPNQEGTTIYTAGDTVIITMPYNTPLNALVPTINISYGASGSMISGNSYNFGNLLIDTVTAQDGITKKYWKIKVVNSLGTDADIISFSTPNMVGVPTIINDPATITFNVSCGTDLANITPSITTSYGANYLPTGALNFTNPVQITVTAANGTTTNVYTVTAIVAPNDSVNIKSFALINVAGTIVSTTDTGTVFLYLPYGTNVTALLPSIELPCGATINPIATMARDFTNPVFYTVTSSNLSTKIWKIKVNTDDAIETNTKENISLYPNPTSGNFTLNVDKNYSVTIFDAIGKLVFYCEVEKGINEINLTANKVGIYFLRIINEKEVQTIRLVKE